MQRIGGDVLLPAAPPPHGQRLHGRLHQREPLRENPGARDPIQQELFQFNQGL